ncbi:MAG: universal stress protein, partial [Anaerolineaceae bacterium]|nr:universal stress protein [Anaerolineaceae bacterium]
LGSVVDETLKEENLGAQASVTRDCLFRDILVAISEADENLEAVWQAVFLNRCSGGNIRGLHVLQDGIDLPDLSESLKEKFNMIMTEAGMQGKFLEIEGSVSKTVTSQSLLSDILILKLNYPLTGSWINRLSHGIPAILRRGKRPVMIVKGSPQALERLLLLYDGSLKSKEGLFIAAYLAAVFGSKVNILTLQTNGVSLAPAVEEAKKYLEKLEIPYQYFAEEGKNLAERVNALVPDLEISTVICGGYSGTGFLDRIIGSDVDEILNQVNVPVLICQ